MYLIQVESVLDEFHAIFTRYSPQNQISMIVRNERLLKLRTTRVCIIKVMKSKKKESYVFQMHQRMAKDFPIERPVIDPAPATNERNENAQKQSEYR